MLAFLAEGFFGVYVWFLIVWLVGLFYHPKLSNVQ